MPHFAEPAAPVVCVCDLDGTLLRSDATLSAFARDGLNRVISAGVRVTIASGRSLQAVRALLTGVELTLPVIGLNGALISDLGSGRHLQIRALTSARARAVVGMLTAYGASPVITSWDGSHDRVHYASAMNAASDWWVAEKRGYGDPRLRRSEDLDTVEHIYCTGWTELQVQHPQADKGHAVPELLELIGLRDSTVLACGDHLNDLGMFAVADESIAPANAHASVLAAATSAVASNDDDGVIRWLLHRIGLY